MAPIMGYTTRLFRKLYQAHFGGFDIAVAPFIVAVGDQKIHPKHLRDVIPENGKNFQLIPQILSNDPAGFVRLAKELYAMGYGTVNWNLGCPFPMVAKKKRGSGLLPFPDHVQAILDYVTPRIPNRLSIKTRLGRKSCDEIISLLPIFNQYPLTELIVHPRTGIQMYEGKVDLEMFSRCIDLSGHPLVYNGDIVTYSDFKILANRFPMIDRWMIGRGAIMDPFLVLMIRDGEGASKRYDRINRFKTFHDALMTELALTLNGPGHLLDRMKGYWSFFHTSFRTGARLFKKIKKINHINAFKGEVDSFFEKEAEWRFHDTPS